MCAIDVQCKPKLGSLLYRTTGALSAKQVYNYQNDPLLAILISPLFILVILTLVEAGGGSKCPIGQEIGSHFSQDHAMVTKILDFIHKHPN